MRDVVNIKVPSYDEMAAQCAALSAYKPRTWVPTEDQKKIMVEYFGKVSTEKLAKVIGISGNTLRRAMEDMK